MYAVVSKLVNQFLKDEKNNVARPVKVWLDLYMFCRLMTESLVCVCSLFHFFPSLVECVY